MNDFTTIPFKDIKSLLPEDCWMMEQYNATGEFNNEKVIFLSGNQQLETLDLDFPGIDDENTPILVLVQGNLRIHTIYNRETDGATGLIVLGNLEAEHIVVGGQEIYITGNLNVSGLYWGDYNHGSLVVLGAAGITVFISTDYGFEFRGGQEALSIQHFFWDEREDEFVRERLATLLLPDCLLEEEDLIDEPYSYKDWLNDYQILHKLENGEPLLLAEPKAYGYPGETIPFVFESRAFNTGNLVRLRESSLFLDGIPADVKERTQEIAYWKDDIFKRVMATRDVPCSERVYFQKADRALFIHWEKQEQHIIGRFTGQKPQYKLAVLCRVLKDQKETDWHYYDPQLPAHRPFGEMTQPLWEDLLDQWSEMEYWKKRFTETVTREKIDNILALPLVREKHSDYYNDEAEDIWLGPASWQFRQSDNPRGHCARISIIMQQNPGNTESDNVFDFYHYDTRELKIGETVPLLYTQKGDGHESSTFEVAIADTVKYRNAIRYFEQLEKHIYRMNQDYLNGKS